MIAGYFVSIMGYFMVYSGLQLSAVTLELCFFISLDPAKAAQWQFADRK